MPNKTLLKAMRELFSKHGKPTSEDPAWATVVMLQVLQVEVLELLMSNIQELVADSSAVTAALADLKSSVEAHLATPVAPAGLSADDQAAVDAVGTSLQGNLAEIAAIKASLTPAPQPAPEPAPAPAEPAPAPAPVPVEPPADLSTPPAS